MFKQLSPTAKYMLLSVAALWIIFCLLGALVILFVYPFEPLHAYLAGLLLSCLVTALRIVMMDRAIGKEVDMPENKAKNYHQLMFFLRYGILIGFAVVLIAFNNIFGVFGGVIGILFMQLSAYCANWLLCRSEKKQKRKIPSAGIVIAHQPSNPERKPFDQDQE